jgi:hypothetical protein
LYKEKRVDLLCCDNTSSEEEKSACAKALWDNVEALEILNQREQLKKFNHFLKKYRDFFGCVKADDGNKGAEGDITIRRLSR